MCSAHRPVPTIPIRTLFLMTNRVPRAGRFAAQLGWPRSDRSGSTRPRALLVAALQRTSRVEGLGERHERAFGPSVANAFVDVCDHELVSGPCVGMVFHDRLAAAAAPDR